VPKAVAAVVEPDRETICLAPPSTREAPGPRWPAIASIAFGAALIFAGYRLSGWILHLHAYRAVAEAMAASMDRNDAAYRAGRERRPRIDPLNPATWSLDASGDRDATEQQRLRTRQVMREIAIVEVGTRIWKLTVWSIGGVIVLLGAAAIKAQRRRSSLLIAVAVLGLLATALTVTGMRVLIVYGGFPWRPIGDYVRVAAAGSAWPWTLLIFLAALHRSMRTRPPTAP
jgi:hypothetical protein